MDEPTTCGQGLAASAKLGALVTALADVLDTTGRRLFSSLAMIVWS